jgi:hypothetical protein
VIKVSLATSRYQPTLLSVLSFYSRPLVSSGFLQRHPLLIVILSTLHYRSPSVSLPEIKTPNLPQVFLITRHVQGFPNVQKDCHSLILPSPASICKPSTNTNQIFYKTFSHPVCNLGFPRSQRLSNSDTVDCRVFPLLVTICQPPNNNKHRIYPATALSIALPIRDFMMSSGSLLLPTLFVVISSTFHCRSPSVSPVKSNPLLAGEEVTRGE